MLQICRTRYLYALNQLMFQGFFLFGNWVNSPPENTTFLKLVSRSITLHFINCNLSDSANISPRFTFPKAEHLKSRKAIEQLFKTGKSFFVHPYKVFYLVQKDDAAAEKEFYPIKAGFAASSRNFKHAVDRNRVKRIGRENYRLQKHPLISLLKDKEMQMQVFFVYTDKTLPTFEITAKKMQVCLNKLISIAGA